MSAPAEKKVLKLLKGVVVSDKMNKTRVVKVNRRVKHPEYQKFIVVHKKYYVHDELNTSQSGDTISFFETRPLSSLKRFRIKDVLSTGLRSPKVATDQEVLQS